MFAVTHVLALASHTLVKTKRAVRELVYIHIYTNSPFNPTSMSPRTAESLTMAIKDLLMETVKLGKASQIWLKGSAAATRWFYTLIHIEIKCNRL